MSRACSVHGEKRNAYRILVKARRKETTTKTKRRSEDYMKIDLRDIEWEDMDWIDLPQDRLQ
jgi:hypothetical protein